MNKRLDLENVIRPTLIRLEDSIILALFERAQYKTNDIIYVPNKILVPGFDGSYMDFLLRGTEEVHARAGRYLHSQEHAFFDDLPSPVVQREMEDSPVRNVDISANEIIKKMYLEAVQKICEKGDDLHYGSSAVCDINCLQLLSRRVHYGTYVAESKFQQDPEGYSELIEARNIPEIKEKLRNRGIETKILRRVEGKGERYNVDSRFIADFYRDKIIPLTIEVEIDYFLKRGKQELFFLRQDI